MGSITRTFANQIKTGGKLDADGLDLTDTFAFTGTVTGAGGTNTPAFRAYLGSTQTLSDIVNTVVQYNTENFDTDSAYDTSTYRFTVPSGAAGKYFFSASAYITQPTISLYSHDMQIRKNGVNAAADNLGLDSSDNYSYISKVTTILDLAESDYVDVNIIANSSDGSTINIFNGSPFQFAVFQGFKLI